jgi:putative NADH-flavin reductase
MRIVLFGASGLTGNEILKQAIDNGHKVTAIVRNPNSIEIKHPNLTIKEGDILKLQSFEEIIKDSDVVIRAVGTGTSFSQARKSTTLYSEGFRNIVTAMRKHRINRFIALLSVGTIPDPNEVLIHKIMIRPMLKGTYDDMRRAESFLAECEDIDWTGIRPLRLNNKPGTGKYRTAKDVLSPKGVNISRADVAEFMLKQMDSKDYIRGYVTIAD